MQKLQKRFGFLKKEDLPALNFKANLYSVIFFIPHTRKKENKSKTKSKIIKNENNYTGLLYR